MSSLGIVIQNGCYGIQKGSRFQPLSNCTFKLLTPVLAGPMSGYIGRAVHQDGNEKEFFYPKGGMPRTKVDHFVSFLNFDNECDFFKRFSVQMTAIQLDTLLTELETAVEIPDLVPRAVSIVGKNINTANEEIWALKRDLFIDASGRLVDPRDHCISWIGHLVKDPGNKIANEDRSADVHLPLTAKYFDLACHLLRGDMFNAAEKDDTLSQSLDDVLRDAGITRESLTAHDDTVENGNFLSSFYTVAMSLIIIHYDKWQMLAGSCPLPAALGEPDSGKSTACKLALAATGGWRKNFFASVTEKVTGKVASQTTMGFVIDDPTRPQDVGEAAKKFFNDGSNINCRTDWSPKCCPLFSINNHVLDWLSKPERERLLSRIIFIPFASIQRVITEEQSALWQQIFDKVLSKVSAVVGQVIAVGKWLTSNEGCQQFNDCLAIVVQGLGEEGKGTRFAKMWACALMACLKMQELTTAVSEEEVINFFMNVIVPHVMRFQKPALHAKNVVATPSSQPSSQGKENFMSRLVNKLESVVENSPKEQNLQFLRTDCTTSRLSGDGNQEAVIAIRAEQFQERCLEGDITPIKPKDLRTAVQAYGLGLRKTEQRFLSPQSNAKRLKSCVMVKRSLFDQSTLRQLDKATGDSQEETEVMETDLYQEKCLPSEATTDLEGLRKEKKQLEQTLEGTRKDYEAEMARLDAENRELKTRASKEKEEREKLQELMKTKERELSSLRQELEMMKEQNATKRAAGTAAFKAASEMLQVKVTPVELTMENKEKTTSSDSRKDRNKCPLCKKSSEGDWQQCTVKQCAQWVHCRCEAKLDESYSCPYCRGQLAE